MSNRLAINAGWNLPALFFCVLFMAGCGSPREKYETMARENLTKIPALAEVAKNAPAVDESATQALASVTGLKLRYQDSNALLIHLEELENPTLRRQLSIRLNNRSPAVDLAHALQIVKQEPETKLEASYDVGLNAESNMNSVWQRMGELKYVLVVRTLELKTPELAGDKTFVAGNWKGEILLFELAGKKLLGGFIVEAINHATVETRTGRDQENLAADLKLTARGNLVAAIRKLVPGVGKSDEPN